jgi:hypothetical protein
MKFERMQRTLLALLKLFEVLEGAHACLFKGVLAVDDGCSGNVRPQKSDGVGSLGINSASEG